MPMERDTVMIVCTGNTCRSPMAEALLKAAFKKRAGGLEKLKVVSCGLSTTSGSPASTNSVKAMERIGLDIKQHKSRPLSQADIEQAAINPLAQLSLAGVTGTYALLLAKPSPNGVVSIVGVLSEVEEALYNAMLIKMAKRKANVNAESKALNTEASDLLGSVTSTVERQLLAA